MIYCKRNLFRLLFLACMLGSCSEGMQNVPRDQAAQVRRDTVTRFFPEKYEKLEEDTMIDQARALRVVIQREVLMDEYVTHIYDLDSFKIAKDVYRDYSSTIMLYRHDTLLCKQTFTKADFPQILDEEFYKRAITLNTWLSSFDSIERTIRFSHVINVPETDWAYDFTIILNDSCAFRSELENID